MKTTSKVKQIVIRFDQYSYDKIIEYSKIEHRGIGDFVRHATLDYIEKYNLKEIKSEEGGK